MGQRHEAQPQGRAGGTGTGGIQQQGGSAGEPVQRRALQLQRLQLVQFGQPPPALPPAATHRYVARIQRVTHALHLAVGLEGAPGQPQQQPARLRTETPGQHGGQWQHQQHGGQAQPPPAMRGHRLPRRRRPGHVGQQLLQQGVAALRLGDRRQFLQRGAVVVTGGHGGIHAQLAASEQGMQAAFVQRPGLDAAQRHAATDAGQQTAFHGQAALGFAQVKAVVLRHCQCHRQGPHRDQHHQHAEHHQRRSHGGAGMDLRHIAISQFAVVFDEVGHRATRNHLVQHPEAGGDHHHAAVGDQPQADHLAGGQAQQGADVGRLVCSGRLGGVRAAADQVFQRQRLIQP